MERLIGVVKQVISADTYILLGPKKNGIAQERQVSLACIQCPKLYVKSQTSEKNEEPFAWESRELIRKLIIGKSVSFTLEYVYNNRQYCSVYFEDTNLSILLLEKGYANLVFNKSVKTNVYSDLEPYYLEAKSKNLGIFGNNINKYVRNIININNDKNENKKIYDMLANKKVHCVIEHVRDGGHLRVYAQLEKKENKEEGNKKNNVKNENKKNEKGGKGSKKKHEDNNTNEPEEKYLTMYYFSISLCGIIVDMYKKEVINNVETVKEETYATETKKFVEYRLLNRDVEIEIRHIDNNLNLYGNIHYKLGNICLLLLKNGYAYINDYTIKYVENPIEYKRALDEAVKLRKKKWINYSEKEVDFEKEYITTVIEVLYGDIIIVDYKNEERRLYLSSIKCEKHNSDIHLNTLSLLAKDYLKKKIVGEQVKIITECVKIPQSNNEGYIPPCSDNKGRMHFVSVYQITKKQVDKKGSLPGSNKINSEKKKKGKKSNSNSKDDKKNESENMDQEDYNEMSLNEELVAEGLAKVVNYVQENEKPNYYFNLQALEKESEKKKLGRFNPHLDIIKINNISGSENALRARSFENTLNKYNNLNAYVDYIYGANKYKIYIPSQNLMINFILLGVNIQKINLKEIGNDNVNKNGNIENVKREDDYVSADAGKKNNKKEKSEYRDIAIQAYKYVRKLLMQRSVQICIITCDKGGNFIGTLKYQNKDIAHHLLSLGYGMLNDIGLKNITERANYIKAAEEAKNNKRNIWAIEIVNENNENGLLNGDKAKLSEFDNIYYCSYVDDINNICLQLKNKQDQLKKFQEDINKKSYIESIPEMSINNISKNALVLAKYIDNYYYRAVVLQINKSKNKCTVKYIDFGNEDEINMADVKKLTPEYSLKNYHQFAIKVALSGLKMPEDNKPDLMIYIKQLLLDKFLYVKFEKKVENIYHVVFYDYEQFTTNKNVKSVNEEIANQGICYVDNFSDTKIFEKLKKEELQSKKNKLGIWSYGDINYDDTYA
ncbi:tudor staphylococcal nuclease, putative [Plasmodium chabaudi chabaudi]|uniref:Tudor staphylococcal nuclease, putative n=1 Tax=Plasmodium chabaudi chabaudi TaxID=31271 RepID=A0A1C6XB80_PLACU|nr:tudor staphylococcal nuclease, putative [Plasmodium chabaudi chabaudi]SCM01976.1 tudor staphylococcal nuclease, putative [Plasmodium chabaudi chabaudi]